MLGQWTIMLDTNLSNDVATDTYMGSMSPAGLMKTWKKQLSQEM